MNPQDTNQPVPQFDPHQRIGDELTVMQPGERVLFVIKRHPVGIVGIYLGTSLLLITIAVLVFGVVPAMFGGTGSSDTANQIGIAVFLVLFALSTGFAFISTHIYWGNRWIVTNDSITQVNQTSLFHRESSQLALHSIEDVTAEKSGVFSHVFDYGVIKAETAGERARFVFIYCPNPNYFAKRVLEAREAYDQQHRNKH